MTLRAAQYCLAGRMWPVGRRLESPDLDLSSDLSDFLKKGQVSLLQVMHTTKIILFSLLWTASSMKFR